MEYYVRGWLGVAFCLVSAYMIWYWHQYDPMLFTIILT